MIFLFLFLSLFKSVNICLVLNSLFALSLDKISCISAKYSSKLDYSAFNLHYLCTKICSNCKINKMNRLNLPPYEIKIKRMNGKTLILDILRRKFVALTPEEWVRQHFIHFLIDVKGYPSALLANEVELTVGEKKMRCDSVLYSRQLAPRMIVEYKAPTIQITQKTFNQIVAYNSLLHAEYLVVSNGISHYCCKIDYEKKRYTFLADIPEYISL